MPVADDCYRPEAVEPRVQGNSSTIRRSRRQHDRPFKSMPDCSYARTTSAPASSPTVMGFNGGRIR